jgi:hypothetical protein
MLHEYVATACGARPQLFPTLLGLRLVNDPEVRQQAALQAAAVRQRPALQLAPQSAARPLADDMSRAC